MKNIEIRFYMKNETEIVSFNDLDSNPFKLGDKIHLSVNDVSPRDLNVYNSNMQKQIVESIENNRKMFSFKTVHLVEEKKYIKINELKESKVIIEYFCEIIPE